ncbi:leucine-rich repeat domain-containing protein [bacterium]|nr:leucine-rich repeat domain-containing protein [bacterium]
MIASGDDDVAPILLGVSTFRFLGQTYDRLYVSTNGLITFEDATGSPDNDDLTGLDQAAIAPLWDDYVNSDSEPMVGYRFDEANSRLIIQWNRVVHYDLEGTGLPMTFQAILGLDSGAEPGSIVFNYLNLDAGDEAFSDGGSATVGIRPAGFVDGGSPDLLLVSYDASSVLVGSGRAIRIEAVEPTEAFAYTSDDTGVTITGYFGEDASLVIPATLDGQPVVGIAALAFAGNDAIESVFIPASVTSIGDGAFAFCSALQFFEVDPDNDSFLSWGGELYASRLETYPSGSYAVPDVLVAIAAGNSFVTDVIVREGVAGIAPLAFAGAEGIESVVVEGSVTRIGARAFEGCTGLRTIDLSRNLAELGSGAFAGCTGGLTVIFRGAPPQLDAELPDLVAGDESPAAVGFYTVEQDAWAAALTAGSFGGLAMTAKDARPVITAVGLPADGTYGVGDVLRFTVTFSEPVIVTGAPQLYFGNQTDFFEEAARFDAAESTATDLAFFYTVKEGDGLFNGVTFAWLTLYGATSAIPDATIVDADTLDDEVSDTADLSIDAITDGAGVLIATPVIVRPVYLPNAGDFDGPLDLSVRYSQAVTLTGAATLAIEIGGTRYESTLTGDGSSATGYLTFLFDFGDVQPDGDVALIGLTLADGATLLDRDGVDAPLDVVGNHPPRGLDPTKSTDGVAAVTFTLAELASDIEGSPLVIVLGSSVYGGTAVVDPDTQSVTFTPESGFTSGGFSYRVAEAGGNGFYDGFWGLGFATITLASGNNAPPTAVALEDQVTTLPDTTEMSVRVKLADIVVTDDGRGTNEITLLGPDFDAFEVEGNVLYLAAGTPLDAATKSTYSVTISVFDPSLPASVAATIDFSLSIFDGRGEFEGFSYVRGPAGVTITGYDGPGGDLAIPDTIAGLPVTAIGPNAFSSNVGLQRATIPAGVKSIGPSAFAFCTGLQSVTIADGVQVIGDNAFQGCTGLPSLVVPGSVASIGWSAFSGCTGLQSLTIESGVRTIGVYAFSGCTGLQHVSIQASVTSIGDAAFAGCTGLQTATIGTGVTSLPAWLFSGCTGLQTVSLPASLTSIGSSAFNGCTGLADLVIPDSVTTIENEAFSDCTGLQTLTLPTGLTSIGDYAFQGCSGLQAVTLPTGLTSIGDYAFQGCTGLQGVTIPASVTAIGAYSFQGCRWRRSRTA